MRRCECRFAYPVPMLDHPSPTQKHFAYHHHHHQQPTLRLTRELCVRDVHRFRDAEKAEQRALETCAETAYPRVANPPLPASKPLASHTGVYVHPAYDRVLVSLDCDETGATAGGAVRGGDEGCRLVFARGPESQVQLGGNLRHVSGDFWLAYLFFPETPDMVQGCVRTEFRVDAGGSVTHIGVDMRVEESHAPLVWFERTGQ